LFEKNDGKNPRQLSLTGIPLFADAVLTLLLRSNAGGPCSTHHRCSKQPTKSLLPNWRMPQPPSESTGISYNLLLNLIFISRE
jgi:hypothetical protein